MWGRVGVLVVVVLCWTASLAAAASYRLIFEDNFDSLDLEKWEHEITLGGGGNWEFQLYSNNRSTSFARDGVLYLRPILTSDGIGEANVRNGYRMDFWGSQPSDQCTGNSFYGCERTSGAGGNYLNPIRSARVRTVKSINIKYGKVEVRARLPRGDWIWPAIWMLPKLGSYGQWPASGEIDIMESRGNSPNPQQQGVDYVASTLHWGPHYPQNGYPLTTQSYQLPGGATFNDDFHVFGVEWTDKGLRTYVDSTTLLQVDWTNLDFWTRGGWTDTVYDNPWLDAGNNGAPFDQEFFLVMNVAVGGTNGYFAEGVGGKPWSNTSPNSVNEFYNAIGQWYPTWSGATRYSNALAVDWVRIYTDSDIPTASWSGTAVASSSSSSFESAFNLRDINYPTIAILVMAMVTLAVIAKHKIFVPVNQK